MKSILEYLDIYGLTIPDVWNKTKIFNEIHLKNETIQENQEMSELEKRKEKIKAIGQELFPSIPRVEIADAGKFKEAFRLQEKFGKTPEKIILSYRLQYSVEKSELELIRPMLVMTVRLIWQLYKEQPEEKPYDYLNTGYTGQVKQIIDELVPEYKMIRVFNPEAAIRRANFDLAKMQYRTQKKLESIDFVPFLDRLAELLSREQSAKTN